MEYIKESESSLLGAHKLIQMIKSWSKVPNQNEQSKYIRKGTLLKGTFDLEQSLNTLQNLEEVLKMMSQVKKKLELDLIKENGLAEDEAGYRLTHSSRFERGLAIERSSVNSIEELRKVIRERSNSRNLGSTSINDEKASSSQSLRFSMSIDHIANRKRATSRSLVARLMGLEEIPSDTGHSARNEEEDKCLVQLTPTLGIEMLKARMLPLMGKKPEVRRKTLKDIFETADYEELMENDASENCKNMSSCYGTYFVPSNRNSHTDEEVTPMMILKTPQLPNLDAKLDKISDRKKVRPTMQIQEKICDNAQILSGKVVKKEVTRRGKPEVEPCQDTKSLACVSREHQRKLLTSKSKRGNEGQKTLPNGKKSGQKIEKTNAIPTSQAKLSTRAPDKPDKRLATVGISERRVSKGTNAPRRNNLDDTPKSKSWNPKEPAKAKTKTGAKPGRKSVDIAVATDNTMYSDVKIINQHCSLPVDTRPIQVEQNSKQCNKGHERKELCREIMVNTSKDCIHSRPSSEAKAEDIELMLWSSESFINQAQKLFLLAGNQTAYHQKKEVVKCRTRNAKLLLDCAREIIVGKSQQVECSNHPILQKRLLSSIAVLSVDHLVKEIANEIDKLRAHHEVGEDGGSEDSIYAILEGDIKCKNVLLNATWDRGWLVCIENVDYVVGQVESVILSVLVEELVLDLVH